MAAAQNAGAVCRAGVARVVITPPVGCSLAGYFHDRISESVRDDLYAKALVLETEQERIALVACDLISVDEAVTGPAKDLILAETGIPPDHVLICATHTHTGPELRPNAVVPRIAEYVATLPGLLAQAVSEAAGAMFEATLRPGRANASGYSFNRLFRLKDGSEVFGKSGREDQVIAEAGPIDPELLTLSVVDAAGNVRGMVVNFALHVDVIGGGGAKAISADWPGELSRCLSAIYGPDMVTLFLQGTCGDINHWLHTPTALPTGGPAKAIQIGRGLAGVAMYAAERAEPLDALPLAAKIEVLDVPYYTRDEKLLEEVATLKQRKDIGDFERYLIERAESWPYDHQVAKVPVQVMRIGEVAIVGLPAEIFVRLGLEIKHWSPAQFTMVVELANARVSTYVPTTDQAERGAYGAKPILSRWLCADAGRRMADAAVVRLHELWG